MLPRCWLGRAVRNEQHHAIEQASRRWLGGRRDDSARTRRNILISTQVEIAELGAANDFNEGGTASLGAAREASQGGEVKMVQVRTASVDVVAREVFGADATIDFLKIDVEGVEIPALRSSLELLGRGGVREASVEFGPAKRWAESEQHGVAGCVEIDQCVGCTRQFFTKSFLGDGAAVLAPSSGEEPASPRHRAGVVSTAWRTTRRFSSNVP